MKKFWNTIKKEIKDELINEYWFSDKEVINFFNELK